MDNIQKSKWQVRIAALVIFLLGFAAGGLALNAYKRWDRNRSEVTRRSGFESMLDSLQLTADQKTQVHQILGDTRQQLQALRKESEPRFAEIRHQADEKLQKVLSPEQWTKFQQERDKGRGPRGRDRSRTP